MQHISDEWRVDKMKKFWNSVIRTDEIKMESPEKQAGSEDSCSTDVACVN